MIRRIAIAAGCLTLAALSTFGTVSASDSGVPASQYPPHAQITVQLLVSNHDMDCDWGFMCEDLPVPIFHFHLQDQLHRVGGLGQSAVTNHLRFTLFGSSYGTEAQARGATKDMWSAAMFRGYREVKAPAGCYALRGWNVYAMACHSGRLETEAIVGFYGATPLERAEGRRDLAKESRYFLRHG